MRLKEKEINGVDEKIYCNVVAISLKMRKALKPLFESFDRLINIYKKQRIDPKIPNVAESFKNHLKKLVDEKFYNLLLAVTKIIQQAKELKNITFNV